MFSAISWITILYAIVTIAIGVGIILGIAFLIMKMWRGLGRQK